ncbi:pancreatic lipase-related protein 2-like, partial [Frankliniella occidentalis]|uniref:Pancreatic lipase-related protein 2-like n=1 Tax=Frankliniella occidentalis TaxID=133901 RepID=A0A9C6XAN3_FRAOC
MVLPQTVLLCHTFQTVLAGTPYVVSLLPRGDCHACCETLEDDVQFYQHLRTGESLRARVAPAGALDPRLPTVVYVHGFGDHAPGPSATTLRTAYFTAGWNVNFVTMDWGPLAAFPWYANAVANSRAAGARLAHFLEGLFRDGVDPWNTHVLGFSLGAEVAGFAGKNLTQQGRRLGRITGLDPAFPLFRWTRKEGHLSTGDADFVDVIHTDSGVYGVAFPIGDVDFYPNGGRPRQPGCSASELRAKGQFPQDFVSCSHSRAWLYYAESVLHPQAFPALRCRSEARFRSGKCRDQVKAEIHARAERAYRSRAANATAGVPAEEREPTAFFAYMGLWARSGGS